MRWWTIWTLCTGLILPVSSLPSWLSGWRACDRNDELEWSSNFRTRIEANGLGGEKGLSRLAVDLRSGVLSVLSLPVPHVYAVIGGGEWGPRAVVKALLESVYVGGWNTGAVVVVDMEEAKKVHRENGVDEAQLWLKDKVASAIVRCPQKATVVFDNVQALKGQDLLVMDPLLLLFDGDKSIMDHGDMKLSGDGSIFLLLLNEEDSEETEGLNGKDRLRHAWTFEGRGFTTDAFVGRMDAALVLASSPSRSPEQQIAIEEAWREISSEEGSANLPGGIGGAITTALRDAEPRALQIAGATVAAIFATGVACWALGCFEETHKPNEDNPRAAPSLWAGSNSDSGGSGGGRKGDSDTAQTARGGGGGHGSGPNESYEDGASRASGKSGRMPDQDARYATPSRRASSSSSSNGGSSGSNGKAGSRGNTTPRRNERGEYCPNGNEKGGSSDDVNGDTFQNAAAQSRAALQTPVNLAPTSASANRATGPTTRSRTRRNAGTASTKGAD